MITSAPVETAPLYGLVLVGGRSRRMGLSKGELRYHGEIPHARYTANLLEAFCEKVFYSCRSDQCEDPLFTDRQIIRDAFSQAGPLNGILSAQESWPSAAFLVVACDLPYLNNEFLTFLVEQRNPEKAATVFENPVRQALEPLCAIYEPNFRISTRLQMGENEEGICPTKILSRMNIQRIKDHDIGALENANHPEDYERAREALTEKENTPPMIGQKVSITVEYFALFRSCARISSEVINSTSLSVSDLYEDLKMRHGFPLRKESVHVAVNDEFVSWQVSLRSGDRIAFIPPVSGG